MENIIFALNVVAPLFILMVIGFILNKLKLIPDEFVPLANQFCFRFCLPVMIFKNIVETDFSKVFNPYFMLYAVVMVVVLALIGMLYARPWTKNRASRGVLVQNFFRSNFVLYGIPVAESMFGQDGVSVTSMLIAVVVPMFNFFAVLVLTSYGSGDKKPKIGKTLLNVLTNPLIIAAVAGLLVVYFNIKLPQVVSSSVSSIGGIATPLMLMTLGANFKFDAMARNLKCILGGVLGRLVLAPTIVLGVAVLLGFRGVEIGALLAFSASPVAVSSYIMASESGCDGELAGQLVVFTTLFSVLTVFMFVFILKTLGIV